MCSSDLFPSHDTAAETMFSSSSLYKYLGWTKSRRTGTTGSTNGVTKNGVPLLLYLDAFKNYFANTQEDQFYMIKGGASRLAIAGVIYKIPATNLGIYPTNGTSVGSFDKSSNWVSYWENVEVLGKNANGGEILTTFGKLSSSTSTATITLDKLPESGITQIVDVKFKKEIIQYITNLLS